MPTTATASSSATDMRQVARVLDYRTIAGVTFPVKLDEQDGKWRAVSTLQTVSLNPPGADALFRR